MIYRPAEDIKRLSEEVIVLQKVSFTLNQELIPSEWRKTIYSKLWDTLNKERRRLIANQKAKIRRRLEKLK